MNRQEIERIVAGFIQPLGRGLIEFKSNIKSRMSEVIPFGHGEHYQNASPYGIVSWPVKGIKGFFLNFMGKRTAPIILTHLDEGRPNPEAEGEVIFYCRKPDGTYPILIYLKPDGLYKLVVSNKVEVHCDNIELGHGSLEKVLNGETFQQRFFNHKHYDSLGNETTVPTPDTQSVAAEDLSSVVKAKK